MRGVLLGLALVGCASATSAGPDVAPKGHGDAPIVPHDGPVTHDGPQGATCTTSQTCTAATALASVCGDTGADMQSASGYQAAWYSVRVTENDNSPFGQPMNLTVQLTSPAGENFDLYVYVNEGSDMVDCTSVTGMSTSTSGADSVSLTWGETGTFANDSDDSRTVSIEIRPVTTSCSSGSTWQLTVFGDT